MKRVIKFTVFLMLISSFFLQYTAYTTSDSNIGNVGFEYFNVKDMSEVNVKEKDDGLNIITRLFYEPNLKGSLVAINQPVKEELVEVVDTPKKIWYLPTEQGIISQSVKPGHVAYDIISNGSSEIVYPIANGVVVDIYTDMFGAKVVIINHEIDGKNYSSQYVHMKSYASNLKVGKNVTINDALGIMGRTGLSTGVHLHITVVDCHYGKGSCSNVGSYLNYATKRYYQGFKGLSSVMNVPASWNNR